MNYFGVDLQGIGIREHYNIYALDKNDAIKKAKQKFIQYREKRGTGLQDGDVKILRIRNIKGETIYFNKERA